MLQPINTPRAPPKLKRHSRTSTFSNRKPGGNKPVSNSSRGNQKNQVRIIGGKWRGRKLSFPNSQGLRPTGDRIRETLFNWLAADIHGANVLDLFAGSGILGIEAASRGAGNIDLVEKAGLAADGIRSSLSAVAADNINLHETSALSFLQAHTGRPYNIIFLDPPFQEEILPATVELLGNSQLVTAGASIYIETDKNTPLYNPPGNWSLHREKTTGNVIYQLYQAN